MFLRIRTTFPILLLFSLILFNSSLYAQDATKGKEIFTTNCTACHQLGKVLIGPNLIGVKSRWKDEKKLHSFIKNSQSVIKGGDPYASGLFAKFNVIMPPQDLNDQQINDVLTYVNAGDAATAVTGGGAGAGNQTPGTGPSSPSGTSVSVADNSGFLGMSYPMTFVLLLALVIILVIVAITLNRISKHLNQLTWEKEHQGEEYHRQPSRFGSWVSNTWHGFWKTANPVFVVMTIVGVIVLICVFDWYGRAQDLGTQIGYSPEQPIRFNHQLHAGQYGIQCQYCHTGVANSKQATIPSLSTCMNCHNYVSQGPQYGTAEIAKIYKAVDYNPETKKYGGHPHPVKWIRIHNLPDHVYFNHSQHVTAGGLACENCHGNVRQMQRVSQVSTLEMGWCINCHRETKVNSDNPYYTSTFDFVKKHKKYTIAQLGGMECSKCHY